MTRAAPLMVGCLLTVTLLVLPVNRAPVPRQAPAPLPSVSLPPSAEHAYRELASRFDRDTAMDVVRFMDQYWRVAGNPGFNASIDHIQQRLARDGFSADDGADMTVRVDEFPNGTRGWDYTIGTLALDHEGRREVLLSRERDRVSLCINSFPTAAGGLTAPLVDVGVGSADADYTGKAVRGAVVLGDAGIQQLWRLAVKGRGAAGVISTAVAPYIRPADATRFEREEQKDVLQWGSVPFDKDAKAFGFKASWRAAARMREELRRGRVNVHVDIESSFYDGPNRSLVAEIRGRTTPGERIVMVAHVQEPGANDNASGSATLYGIAHALAGAIRVNALARPDRTLTFMWVDEVRGSRRWLTSRPADAKGVQYMFALDMTGEDTTKTGGTFLVEKEPDPSAVWNRPSDPHTEWGAGEVKLESLKGSLLNDVHVAMCMRRAQDSAWVVRTNPYEGGSDHTAFGSAGIPSLLNWHFTDRYYHTNQDRIDKVSADEMRNVGISVGSSAWFLASANRDDARATVTLIESAAERRLALEREQGRMLVARASDRAAAEALERDVIAAWIRWYTEALDSILRLPASGDDEALRARVAQARAKLSAWRQLPMVK